MKHTRLWLLSLAGLILAGVLGFGVYRWVRPVPVGHCELSQATHLALGIVTDAATQKKIQKLDAVFSAEFGRVCGQLCSDRAQLSEKLITAKAGDPEVSAALDNIHRQQAQMEQMTWNHIIAVRDLLPAGERAKYIRKVQANWSAGQARLRNVANMNQCQMESGKLKTEK